jgi:hypothetical protein
MRDRLPEFYRENPGTVIDLADLCEARQRALRGEFVSRLAALEMELAAREARPDGRGGRAWLSDAIDREAVSSSDSSCTPLECHRTLADWFERRVGRRPLLIPRAMLERCAPRGLRLRLMAGVKSLLVAWSSNDEVQLDQLPVPDSTLTSGLPVGLHIQVAVLDSPLPRNLHVEGLVLQGVFSELWV